MSAVYLFPDDEPVHPEIRFRRWQEDLRPLPELLPRCRVHGPMRLRNVDEVGVHYQCAGPRCWSMALLPAVGWMRWFVAEYPWSVEAERFVPEIARRDRQTAIYASKKEAA